MKEKIRKWSMSAFGSLNRVKILTQMQLKNNRKRKVNTTGRTLVNILLQVLLFAAISGIFYLIFYVLGILFSITFLYDYRFLIFYIMIMQITSIISCSIGMMNTLFLSKDNVILLSFPCKHSEVYTSKLLVYYITELKKILFLVIPLLLVYAIVVRNSLLNEFVINKVGFFLWIIPLIFILPLIPVLIGAMLSLPLAYIKRLLTTNSIVKGISLLLSLVALYFITHFIIKALPNTIEVITQYNLFLNKAKAFIYNIASYGLYVRSIVLILYNSKVFINLLIILSLVVVGFIVSTFIIRPFFFKVASHSMEEATTSSHKENLLKTKKVFFTFLKKDIIIDLRDLGRVIGDYLYILIMPPIVVFALAFYSRMSLNVALAERYIEIFISIVIFLLSFSNNNNAATSITREGSEFVLVKTAPNKMTLICWSKLTLLVIESLIVETISFALLGILIKIENISYLMVTKSFLGLNIPLLLIMYLLVVLMNIALTFHGIQMDIRNPHLQEYASTGQMKDNNNILKTNIYGMFASILLVILLFLISPVLVLIITLLILMVRITMFTLNINAFFPDIEV